MEKIPPQPAAPLQKAKASSIAETQLEETKDSQEARNDTDPIDEDLDSSNDSEGSGPGDSSVAEVSPNKRFKRSNILLGHGAYKTVYRAMDNDTGNEVAWNLIYVDRLFAADKKRIFDEISFLKKLSHPNIVHGIATWYDPEKQVVVFITELVHTTLKKHIMKIFHSKPKLKAIKGFCRAILTGIKYLHEQIPPIIHRDIKCDNIFLNPNKGEIKIGDLGLATTLKGDYSASLVGTPEYMAPELYEEKYDTKVDVYAFGMCLLEMVTLESPYKECANVGIIYRKVCNGIPPESLKRIEDLDLKAIIAWCLSDSKNRPSVQELLDHPFFAEVEASSNNCEIKVKPVLDSPNKTYAEDMKTLAEGSASASLMPPSAKTSIHIDKITAEKSDTPKPARKKAKKPSIGDALPEQGKEARALFTNIKKLRAENLRKDQTHEVQAPFSLCAEEIKGLNRKKSVGRESERPKSRILDDDEDASLNSSSKKLNSSMVILNKEYPRDSLTSKEESIDLIMTIEVNKDETWQLKFKYFVERDTPESVAEEMIKDLGLSKESKLQLITEIKEKVAEHVQRLSGVKADPSPALVDIDNGPKKKNGQDAEEAKKEQHEVGVFDHCKTLEQLQNDFAKRVEEIEEAYNKRKRALSGAKKKMDGEA